MKEKYLAGILGIGILGILMAFAFVVAGCDTGFQGTVTTDAQAPQIIAQPQANAEAIALSTEAGGVAVRELKIEAESPDGGRLEYQWYSATADQHNNNTGTLMNGETDEELLIELDAGGTFYYYVVIKNINVRVNGKTSATVTSNPAVFQVTDAHTAAFPQITAKPLSGTFYKDPTNADVRLSVEAESVDSGVITYQWYSATSANSYTGTPPEPTGSPITGAIRNTYSYTTNSTSNAFYYVVVTNTRADLATPSNKTASDIVTVTVADGPNATFTVDTATKYQYVRGYGGMNTPWNNIPAPRLENYEKMYHPGDPNDPGNTEGRNGLGYNIMRTMIMAPYENVDQTMQELVVTGRAGSPPDRPYEYQAVKIVNKYNGYVFACPWTPPAVWKTNNSINGGGKLKTENYLDFANYLNDYARHMAREGAPIYAMSMQNEPSYTTTTYEGCEYNPTEHKAWWDTAKKFTRDGPGGTEGNQNWTVSRPKPTAWGGGKARDYVLTMSGEAHNEPGWLNSVVTDATTKTYVDVYGRHIYGSWRDESQTGQYAPVQNRWGTDIRNANEAAGIETWMTEHNVNSNGPGYINDSTWDYMWQFANEVDLVIRLNKENAFVWWTSVRFYSMIGDGQYGTVHSSVLPRGFALSHYAKFSKEMRQVGLSYTGTLADGTTNLSTSNINAASNGNTDTTAKVTAFADFAQDGTVNAISLVMYTPTSTAGANGRNLGTVKIEFPAGFVAGKAIGMRSTSANRGQTVTESVALKSDGTAAYINLPASQILSVKFFKKTN